jgi:formate hydrogenlyase subunit 3/multisubunit Na+/H+ antiporter MnhD subunit
MCGVEPRTNFLYVPMLSTFLALAGVFVVLRFVARIMMDLKLWWDDWLNFAAWVLCLVQTAIAISR